MKKDVHLLRFKKTDPIDETGQRIIQLLKQTSLDQKIQTGDMTAIKVHFGEHENTTFLPPHFIKPLADVAKQRQAKPFVTDTNVLYKSRRDNAVDHLILANEHGFSMESLGAPIIISDGIIGHNETTVEVNAPTNKVVHLATEFITCNSIIVATHATGHLVSGLGATIKNLGMGMASRKGKLTQHSVSKPYISPDECQACGLCQNWCPADSIIKADNYFEINDEKCIGCGECLAMCRMSAVKFNWDSGSELLQKQIAEHALGIVKQKKDRMIYLTFLINMTKDCDCLKQPEKFLMEDIGVLAGDDPVAIDQAVLDLTTQNGKNLAELSYPKLDATTQLEYGEEIGLGSRHYNLKESHI